MYIFLHFYKIVSRFSIVFICMWQINKTLLETLFKNILFFAYFSFSMYFSASKFKFLISKILFFVFSIFLISIHSFHFQFYLYILFDYKSHTDFNVLYQYILNKLYSGNFFSFFSFLFSHLYISRPIMICIKCCQFSGFFLLIKKKSTTISE